MAKGRDPVQYTEPEMERLRWWCQTLGTTFQEFIHDASIQMLDELDGISGVVARAKRMMLAELTRAPEPEIEPRAIAREM